MTLFEMSADYAASADALRTRIAALRELERSQQDEESSRRIRLRIAALLPLLRESRELAALTAHYYDRSFHNYEKYTL